MTRLTADFANIAYQGPDTEASVVIAAEVPRLDGGKTIVLDPEEFFAVDGKVTTPDLSPGPARVWVRVGRWDQPYDVVIPDTEDLVELFDLIEQYTPPDAPTVSKAYKYAKEAEAHAQAALDAQIQSEQARDHTDQEHEHIHSDVVHVDTALAAIQSALNQANTFVQDQVPPYLQQSALNNTYVPEAQTPLNAARAGLATTEPNAAPALTTAMSTAVTQGRPLDIPAGQYSLATRETTVNLPGGARWGINAAPGAQFKIADGTVTSNYWVALIVKSAGTGDVERVDVNGLAIDHNRRGQTLPANEYDWEHSASLRVSGRSAGRIRHVNLTNLDFRDPIADCVLINDYFIDTLRIAGMRVRDRSGTRSDIQLSGLPRSTVISDFIGTRIEAEALAAPADVTHNFHIQIVNAYLSDMLDLGVGVNRGRVNVQLNNVRAGDAIFGFLRGMVANSQIHFVSTGSQSRRINQPDGLTFSNCDLYLHADAAGVIKPLTFYPESDTASRVTFDNCRFHVVPVPGYTGPFTGSALRSERSWSGNADTLTVRDCWFDDRFPVCVDNDRTKNVVLDGSDFAGVALKSTMTGSNVTFDGGNFSRATSIMQIVPEPTGSLVVRGITGRAAQQAYTVTSGASNLATMPTVSSRILLVDAAPTGGGFRGDRARLVAPVAGQACEWVCTASNASAATWKVSQVLAA